MYEDQTFQTVLRRILKRAPAGLDTRESSFLYQASAPSAAEHANLYNVLDRVQDSGFYDTSDRGGKLEKCKERGIDIRIFEATRSICELTTQPAELEIAVGERFNLETVNFTVEEKLGPGRYLARCETPGTVGNITGVATPVSYIRGLKSAQISQTVVYAEDEAPESEIDAAFYATLDAQAFGGNRADYFNKVRPIDGVGGVKLYSASEWKGGGTVRIVITSSSYTKPSGLFVSRVQSMIDPQVNAGDGYGIAPVGHTVTVEGAEETGVDFSCGVVLKEGFTLDDILPQTESAADDYLTSLNREWEYTDRIIVRISQIEARILEINGIVDIFDTKLNGERKNLYLDRDSLAKRGTVSVTTG